MRRSWVSVLHEAISAAFSRVDSEPLLVRIGVSAGKIDPFEWLAGQSQTNRIIWHSRHHNEIVFTCGAAKEVSGSGPETNSNIEMRIQDVLGRPGDDMRFFGGMRFDRTRPSDELWRSFSGYRFVLPRFELIARRDQVQVYCNLVFPEDIKKRQSILADILSLEVSDSAPEQSRNFLSPVVRVNHPEQGVWKERINWALEKFENNDLEKVVLARRADFEFVEPIKPFLLLKKLIASTPNCFHYYFEASDGSAFLGATPERLFYRNGLLIESEAVAGTQPRGATLIDDEHFRASLLTSEKELREHAFVREFIRDILDPLCESVSIDHEASEMKLTMGRHLVSRITGVLLPGVSDMKLLDQLHPTPAVGGFPGTESIDVIREVEEFDRGWYAGPVGWIGQDSAHFAVALRCGLVRGKTISLFSGAGIVRGSEPESEWKEIEQKILDFINVLELDMEQVG